MKRIACCLVIALFAGIFLVTPKSAADDPASAVRRSSHRILSLDLKFTRKKENALEHMLTVLDYGPNGYATGFTVGDGLVMTAYHVVSGELSAGKKIALGFSSTDDLDVRVYVNGCEASLLKVDEAADLALLRTCRPEKQSGTLAFQPSLSKDERLFVIARPHGEKIFSKGSAYGPYEFRGQQYWLARINGRDGYSGSPVYNDKAEIVGVFSGYDWTQRLAVISPASRAQKLLDDYTASPKP